MTDILLILSKVFVKEFYRLNAGFFLIIITLAFGFMSGTEHRALAEFFISSPTLMLVPITIWVIYALKVINFNGQQLLRQENRFLFELSLLSPSYKWITAVIALSVQLIPAIAYGLFLILIALRHLLLSPVLMAGVALLSIIMICALILKRQLHHPEHEMRVTGLKKFIDNKLTKPFVQFTVEWILRRDPALVFGTKIFTGLLIFAVSNLYSAEAYDWRLMAMVAALAFSANFMIISQLHSFENIHFQWMRHLPFSFSRRLSDSTLALSILCIPEFAVLIKYFPDQLTWLYIPYLVLYGISIGIIFYGMHFLKQIREKDFTHLIFALVISWIVLILFSVPLYVLAILNVAAGVWMFKEYYYTYEHASK